jgi:hypothetical protein
MMDKEQLDAIATREAHCKPYGAAVTLSIGERDELVALARDGMRYRWVRDGLNDAVHILGLYEGNEMDLAIDELLAKEGA